MIKISVIVPVYNVEDYLTNCLNSLVNQNYKQYEIIIINDGSTDNSVSIIENYSKKYPKLIKYYNKSNGGLSSARNYGINKSNGEYLLFVDSDDSLEPDTLNILNNNINNNDILVFNMNVIRNKIKLPIYEFNNRINNNIKKYIVANPSACNKLIKKEVLTKNHLKFEEGIYYEDLNLLPTLVKYTKNINFINNALYNYYVRNNSIMNENNYNVKQDDIFKVCNNLYSILNKDYSLEIEYLFIEHLLRNAGLRYIDYKKYDKINMIIDLIKRLYPQWYKNPYYKKYYTLKQKVMCNLIIRKQYKFINILRKS